jgi:DNA-binding NtrC family response regulator
MTLALRFFAETPFTKASNIATLVTASPAGAVSLPSKGECNPYLYLNSPEMKRLLDQVRSVAPQDTTILLDGETGTGKNRLGRLIHELSPRRAAPFLVVNCGALSSGLIESELFGYVRGAFTGAHRARAGKFAEAGEGTLLLDEIDAVPLNLQAKLLRAVEDRLFEAVGSNRTYPVRARLLAASNRALEQEVAEGRFRADLYYRLNIVEFQLPSLRQQRDMIEPLFKEFIAEFAARSGRGNCSIADEALRVLVEYDWPGNIRELRNVAERAVALCPGQEIQLDDLPRALLHAQATGLVGLSRGGCPPKPAGPASLAQSKEQIELLRIRAALHKHHNNRRRAATELGISRVALYYKLHKHGLIELSQKVCAGCGRRGRRREACRCASCSACLEAGT